MKFTLKSMVAKWCYLLPALALLPLAAVAQRGPVPPQPLQYMTLTVLESSDSHLAKMLLAPAANSFGEVYLEGYNSATQAGNDLAYQRNQERLTQQLDKLAGEGWEVMEVHPAPYLPAGQVYSTRYLLRRPKP